MTRKGSSATGEDREMELRFLHDQLNIAASALQESFHWLEELGLNSKENVGRINRALTILHSHRYEIIKELPELNPPQARLWSDDSPPYDRRDVLRYLFDQLRFADALVHDAYVRARALGLRVGRGTYSMSAAAERTAALKDFVAKLVDEVISPGGPVIGDGSAMPRDRRQMLGRLDQDLTLAATVLDNCAGLFRELNLSSSQNIRTIGECLAPIFEVQWQIYPERPDLVPENLRDAFERQEREQDDAR